MKMFQKIIGLAFFSAFVFSTQIALASDEIKVDKAVTTDKAVVTTFLKIPFSHPTIMHSTSGKEFKVLRTQKTTVFFVKQPDESYKAYLPISKQSYASYQHLRDAGMAVKGVDKIFPIFSDQKRTHIAAYFVALKGEVQKDQIDVSGKNYEALPITSSTGSGDRTLDKLTQVDAQTKPFVTMKEGSVQWQPVERAFVPVERSIVVEPTAVHDVQRNMTQAQAEACANNLSCFSKYLTAALAMADLSADGLG